VVESTQRLRWQTIAGPGVHPVPHGWEGAGHLAFRCNAAAHAASNMHTVNRKSKLLRLPAMSACRMTKK
jgi:hypothetical protein